VSLMLMHRIRNRNQLKLLGRCGTMASKPHDSIHQMVGPEDPPAAHEHVMKLSMEQAIKFWESPSLLGVSSSDKLAYLRSKGLCEAKIHQMWDQIMARDEASADKPSNLTHQSQSTSVRTSTFPGQYPFGSSLPQQTYPYQPQFQEDQSALSRSIPALLTVGGILGLAAAASVRWLNGGDFSLFPPPTKGNDIIVVESSSNLVFQEEEYSEEEYRTNDNMEELSDMIKTNFRKQETLLQRLVDKSGKDFTDKSMALLKEGKHDDMEQIEKMKNMLVDVFDRLDELKQELDGHCVLQITMVLEKLEGCIKLNDGLLRDEGCIPVPLGKTAPIGCLKSTHESIMVTREIGETRPVDPLYKAIEQLVLDNDSIALKEGVQFLYLYVLNLSNHPHVPRYRKIYTSNESFQKVGTLNGGKELLLALDFIEESDNLLAWKPVENEQQSVKKLTEALAALSILKSTTMDQEKQSMAVSALAAISSQPAE